MVYSEYSKNMALEYEKTLSENRIKINLLILVFKILYHTETKDRKHLVRWYATGITRFDIR